MNSGLPSLLDAIFSKQDLDDISLDEIYELISEFPSFNAGHFLLSKKLKEQGKSDYEKETMRTALYFNNPFWLESVLNEERHVNFKNSDFSNRIEPLVGSPVKMNFTENAETQTAEFTNGNYADDIKSPHEEENSSIQAVEDHHPSVDNLISDENVDSQIPIQEQSISQFSDEPVKSFDDLISKYHIESLTNSPDSLHSETDELIISPQQQTEVKNVESQQSDDQTAFQPVGSAQGEKSEEISGDYEIREEVVNEYGIFEEVKIKRNEFDLEDFDKPANHLAEQSTDLLNSAEESITPPVSKLEPAIIDSPDELQDRKDIHESREDLVAHQTQADYEAFDRPFDRQGLKETEGTSDITSEEESITEIYSGQDQRLEFVESPQWTSDQTVNEISMLPDQGGADDQVSEKTLEESKKPLFSEFDQKKAESIVFAPYHMIDYFASQGIKLNLEENPVDSFGRQLKSFTDWLKVMKKLPAHTIAEKADEKEVDRIRHFAAHSIDEREILTESMAEVLAKQGMFENAIALFQKLSLIYPPKSAYFASRIEQIKASLP